MDVTDEWKITLTTFIRRSKRRSYADEASGAVERSDRIAVGLDAAAVDVGSGPVEGVSSFDLVVVALTP